MKKGWVWVFTLIIIISTVNAQSETTCTDSDGGREYYTKGTTTDAFGSRTDTCYDPTKGVINSCTPEDNYCALEEFICKKDRVTLKDRVILDLNYIACPNGCTNGECNPTTNCEEFWYCDLWSDCINGIQTRECRDAYSCGTKENKPIETQTCTETSEVECTDSDGGRNYAIKGVTSTKYGSSVDKCYAPGQNRTAITYSCSSEDPYCALEEYICVYDEILQREILMLDINYRACPNGCTDGACNPYDQCVEDWSCIEWGGCNNNEQIRTCTDSSGCGATTDKPETTQTCTTSTECTDSDGGREYYTKGTTTDAFRSRTDTCYDPTKGRVNSCTPEDNYCALEEFICKKDRVGLDLNYVACPNGCTNGECNPTTNCEEFWYCDLWSDCINEIQTRECRDEYSCGTKENKPIETQTCTETSNVECTDSDGGRNYAIKGVTSTKYGSRVDTCYAPGHGNTAIRYSCSSEDPYCALEEFVCVYTSRLQREILMVKGWACPNGCTDGACNPYDQCVEDWSCIEWDDCNNNKQTRICTDNNNCGTTFTKPISSQNCVSIEPLCGNDERPTICHIVPNNNPGTITVSRDSLDSHMAHGDYCGECMLVNIDEFELTYIEDIIFEEEWIEIVKEDIRAKNWADKVEQALQTETSELKEKNKEVNVFIKDKKVTVERRTDIGTNIITIGDTIINTALTLLLDTISETPKIYVRTSSGEKKEVNILPEEAISIANLEEVTSVEIEEEEGKAVYNIKGIKKARLFNIYPVSGEVEEKINVEDGSMVKTEAPWWWVLTGEY